jgi:hypothetical protein
MVNIGQRSHGRPWLVTTIPSPVGGDDDGDMVIFLVMVVD